MIRSPLFFLLASVLVLGTLGGCASPSFDATFETGESAAPNTVSWRSFLVCDGGAAVLDVDEGERRNVQLVVRDPGALTHFAEHEFFRFGTREFIITNTYPYTRYGIEFSTPTGPQLRPFDMRGIFDAKDFSFFLGNVAASAPNSTLAGRFYSIYREGTGVTVELKEIALRGCAGTIRTRQCGGESPAGGGCGSYCDGPDYTALTTLSSWHFNSCASP